MDSIFTPGVDILLVAAADIQPAAATAGSRPAAGGPATAAGAQTLGDLCHRVGAGAINAQVAAGAGSTRAGCTPAVRRGSARRN
jgi:hypothetical protein